MKLHLLRHAESYGNATGNYSIAESDSLSERGMEQAKAVADDLAGWEFTRIVASPLKRAQDTIAPYLQSCGRKAEIWPEIAEACWHDQREQAADTCRYVSGGINASVPNLFTFRDNRAVVPGHPESFGSGLFRVHSAAMLLPTLAKHEGSVLMATHGHFIREILNYLLDVKPFSEFHHDNCAMTLLTYKGSWKLEYCNEQPSGLP